MRTINNLELGLMFWTTEDAEQTLTFVEQFGLKAGQLGFPGELPLAAIEAGWKKTLHAHPDFAITSAVCSYQGEDYGSIQIVQNTVGLVPPATRAERIERTKQVANIAANLGIASVTCHIGFVPADHSSAAYTEIRDVVRDICDHIAPAHQIFALETGQETATELLEFLQNVDRPNLKINFDPANMILYGTGDPIEALQILAKHVVSVHCKDGDWPDRNKPGTLGTERRLGDGAVDFPRFLQTLKSAGYTGILSIEREELDAAVRMADIKHAVHFLNGLLEN